MPDRAQGRSRSAGVARGRVELGEEKGNATCAAVEIGPERSVGDHDLAAATLLGQSADPVAAAAVPDRLALDPRSQPYGCVEQGVRAG